MAQPCNQVRRGNLTAARFCERCVSALQQNGVDVLKHRPRTSVKSTTWSLLHLLEGTPGGAEPTSSFPCGEVTPRGVARARGRPPNFFSAARAEGSSFGPLRARGESRAEVGQKSARHGRAFAPRLRASPSPLAFAPAPSPSRTAFAPSSRASPSPSRLADAHVHHTREALARPRRRWPAHSTSASPARCPVHSPTPWLRDDQCNRQRMTGGLAPSRACALAVALARGALARLLVRAPWCERPGARPDASWVRRLGLGPSYPASGSENGAVALGLSSGSQIERSARSTWCSSMARSFMRATNVSGSHPR